MFKTIKRAKINFWHYHQGASVVYHQRLAVEYHHCESGYSLRLMICTLKRDDIQPKGLMICTTLRAVMICQVFDLDKKNRQVETCRFFNARAREPVGSKSNTAFLTQKKSCKSNSFLWRKRWDSNPRAREDYLISSQARYDHFDTLPCFSGKCHFLS